MIPPNLLINPGAETGTVSPWIIGGPGTPAIDSGNLRAYISFYEQSVSQTFGIDEGDIGFTFRTLNNTSVATVPTISYLCSSGWCGHWLSYPISTGTSHIDYIILFQ